LRLKNDGEKCGMTFSKPTLLKGGRHEMDKKFAVIFLCKEIFSLKKWFYRFIFLGALQLD